MDMRIWSLSRVDELSFAHTVLWVQVCAGSTFHVLLGDGNLGFTTAFAFDPSPALGGQQSMCVDDFNSDGLCEQAFHNPFHFLPLSQCTNPPLPHTLVLSVPLLHASLDMLISMHHLT